MKRQKKQSLSYVRISRGVQLGKHNVRGPFIANPDSRKNAKNVQHNDTSDWIVTAYFQEKLNADPKRTGRKEKNGSKNNNNISTQTNQRH